MHIDENSCDDDHYLFFMAVSFPSCLNLFTVCMVSSRALEFGML